MTQFFSTQWTRASAVAAITLLMAACGKGQQQAAAPRAAATSRPRRRSPSSTARPFHAMPTRLPEGPAARQAGDRRHRGRKESGPGSDDQHAAARRPGREGWSGQGSGRRHAARSVAHADPGGRRRAEVCEGQRTDGRRNCTPRTMRATGQDGVSRLAHPGARPRKRPMPLIKKIKGGAKFEDVAKAESTDNSKANGGDLGWFTTGAHGQAVRRCRQGAEERRDHARAGADPVWLARHQARRYARRRRRSTRSSRSCQQCASCRRNFRPTSKT